MRPVTDAPRPPPVIELLLEARARDLGGMQVARILPSPRRRMIGPFIFLDHMGPTTAPGDVLPHPHIGLSTVTYLFTGEAVHRDSLGTCQVVRAGDVNLMTAGSGVVHSERQAPPATPAAPPAPLHGVQIWLALPTDHEDDAPSFHHYPAAQLPTIAEPGVQGTLLLGEAYGLAAPADHPSRPLLVDLALDRGGCSYVPGTAAERGVYVVEGRVRIGGYEVGARQLAAISPAALAADARVEATEPARILVLGGPALGRRLIDWNFVASSQERIDRARQRWLDRAFPKIPGDDDELVPLPGERPHRST